MHIGIKWAIHEAKQQDKQEAFAEVLAEIKRLVAEGYARQYIGSWAMENWLQARIKQLEEKKDG